MRIVLGLASLEVGGTERQVVRLARELNERGHEVLVLTLSGDGPLIGVLNRTGVQVRDLAVARSSPWTLLRLLRLPAILRSWRPNVVHAFLFWTYVLLIPSAWVARVPVRLTGRRNLGTEKGRSSILHFLEQLADRLSTGAVANSRAVAAVVQGSDNPPPAIHVIPNGVDIPARPALLERQPAEGVMVANLIAYKGHLDLIEALSTLRSPPRIHCLGMGPEREAIVKALRAHGLTDVVLLHGRVMDTSPYFERAQFAVLASHEEGSPNAVLEAMAHGLPVVATDVGGVPELIEPRVEGLLAPAGRPELLGKAIEEMALDADLRKRLGQAARRRAIREHNWARVVEAHEALYAKQLESARHSWHS